jgi:acyl-CoA dehydrogenase
VLQTAWKIDRYNDYNKVRMDISAVKVVASKVLSDVATKALQIHGSLGLSEEMPFVSMLINGLHVGLADGPSEIHTLGVAKQLLTQYKPTDGVFPTQHIPTLTEQARKKYASTLVKHGR